MKGPQDRMRIALTDERRRKVLEDTTRFYREAFDEDLSRFRAERLLEFFLQALGPAVYQQGIQDARAFLLGKLEDLDVEFYDPRAAD